MEISPGILQLAERIENDIRTRALASGHPYDTTAEAARRFGVSTNRANRALQLLSNRGIIVRRQRAGATVGNLSHDSSGNDLRRLHIIVSRAAVRTEGLLDDGIMLGLQTSLPGVRLQQHYLPREGAGSFINDILAAAFKNPGQDGFVLFRSPSVVQRALAQSGLPTVVAGGLQPSVEGVASLDRDQHQIGVELADYALRRRCRRFVCLLRDQTGPGDRHFARGVTQTLADAGIASDRLAWEWVEADTATAQATVKDHLSGRGKIGFLCRNEFFAEQVAASIESSDRKSSNHVIIMADCYRSDPNTAPFPYPIPIWSAEQIGIRLGELLIEQTNKDGKDRRVTEILVPVKRLK